MENRFLPLPVRITLRLTLGASWVLSGSVFSQTLIHSAGQSDLEKLYERRGFCAAQQNSAARLECLEKLTQDLFSALAVARTLSATTVLPKSEQDLEADRKAVVNRNWGGVFRAFTAIEASIDVGVTYNQYGPLLQAAATELALVKEDTRSLAAGVFKDFTTAIDAYQDAATWWERDISFYSRRDNSLSYPGGLPFSQVGLERLVQKWSLPVRNADLLGFHRGVSRATALQTMWAAARQASDSARKSLLEHARAPRGEEVPVESEEIKNRPRGGS
jgi:hypothetical protein